MAEQGDERFLDKRAAARMGDESSGQREEPVAAAPGDGAAGGGAPRPENEPAGEAEAAADGNEAAASDQPAAEDDVAELKDKADRFYANWQRSAADFVNYKRRVEQERQEFARVANAALIINLLPIYDDLERAVNTVDARLAGLNWVQGIEAIYRKFGAMLESMGVQEIPAEGEQFDPNCHEAVGEQPGEEGKVLHVAQRGYRLGDKVIRPAMVIVGNGQPAPEQQEGA